MKRKERSTMANRVEGIAYNVIPVSDVSRSVEWYVKHFNFDVQHQRDDYAGLFFNNRPIINLKKSDHPSRATFEVNGESHWIITFYTKDIETFHKQLSEEGIETGAIMDEGHWGKFFTLKDPDGNIFDIWENQDCVIHF